MQESERKLTDYQLLWVQLASGATLEAVAALPYDTLHALYENVLTYGPNGDTIMKVHQACEDMLKDKDFFNQVLAVYSHRERHIYHKLMSLITSNQTRGYNPKTRQASPTTLSEIALEEVFFACDDLLRKPSVPGTGLKRNMHEEMLLNFIGPGLIPATHPAERVRVNNEALYTKLLRGHGVDL